MRKQKDAATSSGTPLNAPARRKWRTGNIAWLLCVGGRKSTFPITFVRVPNANGLARNSRWSRPIRKCPKTRSKAMMPSTMFATVITSCWPTENARIWPWLAVPASATREAPAAVPAPPGVNRIAVDTRVDDEHEHRGAGRTGLIRTPRASQMRSRCAAPSRRAAEARPAAQKPSRLEDAKAVGKLARQGANPMLGKAESDAPSTASTIVAPMTSHRWFEYEAELEAPSRPAASPAAGPARCHRPGHETDHHEQARTRSRQRASR